MVYECILCGGYYFESMGIRESYPPLKGDIAISISSCENCRKKKKEQEKKEEEKK